jgi:hypothetical protein
VISREYEYVDDAVDDAGSSTELPKLSLTRSHRSQQGSQAERCHPPPVPLATVSAAMAAEAWAPLRTPPRRARSRYSPHHSHSHHRGRPCTRRCSHRRAASRVPTAHHMHRSGCQQPSASCPRCRTTLLSSRRHRSVSLLKRSCVEVFPMFVPSLSW